MADHSSKAANLLRLSLEVDGAMVARQLGLEVTTFRQLMKDDHIAVLCERGVGEDEGTYRASFYHGKRRVRLLLDARGRLLSNE